MQLALKRIGDLFRRSINQLSPLRVGKLGRNWRCPSVCARRAPNLIDQQIGIRWQTKACRLLERGLVET